MKADVEIRAERATWIKRKTFHWGTRSLQRVLERRLAGKKKVTDPVVRFVAHWLVGRWVLDRLGLLRLRRATCGGASVLARAAQVLLVAGRARVRDLRAVRDQRRGVLPAHL